MDARKVSSLLPSPLLVPALKSFIKIKGMNGNNYFENKYEGTKWRYYYDDITSLRFFHSARVKENNTGRESIPIEYFNNLSQNHDAMIDMGAHMGSISVILGKLNPDLPLHCFDPVPSNLEKLRNNIEKNNIDAYIHESVIGTESKDTTFYQKTKDESRLFGLPGESVSHSNSKTKNANSNFQRTEKRQVDISKFIKENNIKRPFMKIDIEGNEYEVMNEILHNEGLVDGFSGIVEIHPDLIDEGYGHEIVFWLEQQDIDIEWVKTENPRRMALYCTTIKS